MVAVEIYQYRNKFPNAQHKHRGQGVLYSQRSAYGKGWEDRRMGRYNRNPYNKRRQPDFWQMYEEGYDQFVAPTDYKKARELKAAALETDEDE